MTALNKFKKFMSNLKEAACKKLKDVFAIVTAIKTGINVVKGINDMKDGKQVNFQNILQIGKDKVLPLVTQALQDEVKTIQ
jgi:hypothetical protein